MNSVTRSHDSQSTLSEGLVTGDFGGQSALRILISVWILSYYLLAHTFWERVSLGGLSIRLLHDQSYPVILGLISGLSCVSIYLLKSPKTQDHSATSPPLWLLAAAYFLPVLYICCVSADYPVQIKNAVSEVTAISAGIIAISILRGKQQIIATVTFLAFIQAAYSIVYQHERSHLLTSGTVIRAGGTFNDPNNLYVLMLIALPFAIIGAITAKSDFSRLAFLVASSAIFSCFVLTWYRGAVIGLAGGIIVLTYLVTRSKRSTILVFAAMLLLCGLTFAIRSSGVANQLSIRGSDNGRTQLWQDALAVVAEHPISGIGVGAFSATVISARDGVTTDHMPDEPKNLYLDWLIERGVGGATLMALFAWTISAKIRSALPDALAIAAAASWMGLILAGLTDTPFGPGERYVGNCCLGILLGITALLRNTQRNRHREA